MFSKIQRNFSKIFNKIILQKILADFEVIMKKFRRKIQKTLCKFLKNFKEFYITNETLIKTYEKLDI